MGVALTQAPTRIGGGRSGGDQIDPMAHWIVRKSLAPLDIEAFTAESAKADSSTEAAIGKL